MNKRLVWLIAVLATLALVAAQCGAGTPAEKEPASEKEHKEEAKEEAPTEKEEPASEASGARFGQVTDAGGVDDKGFNQLAWTGLQQAGDELGVEVKVLESKQQTDYEKNINEFINEGFNGIITVGFLLADATKAAADANPDTMFGIVDFPSQASNDMGMLFAVDQPSFQAGYLAAGMSETGIVCTYGGIKIPPVTGFMVGFEQGVSYYNAQKGADVQVLGWETDANVEGGGEGAFTGNFESLDDGRSFAENFFDEGCDIILPVAGPVGVGSAAAAQDRGVKLIGVDADWYETAAEYSDVYLTSVLKNIDVAVLETVIRMNDGSFEGGTNYVGILGNGGVGLASFHDYEDAVSQEMRDELEMIKQGIIDGSIDSTGSATTEMPEDTSEVASKGGKYGQVTDVGGIDDKGFNQLAWAGMQAAKDELGIEAKVLESKQQTDYEKNLNEFFNEGYDGIITVGFLLADATKVASEANPDTPIAIVDFPSQTSGDMGLLFAVDQPSFMAGYLAAGMSETGVVCTYGGIKIPPVTAFMVGFEGGIKYYNEQQGAEVALLGWETDADAEGGGEGAFTGNFESLDDGRSYAENFFDEGCDIIFPVAGPVGLGSASAAQDRGLKVIGVDANLAQTAPEFQDVYLTSVLKNIDIAVFEAVTLMDTDQFEGGSNFVSTLENGGVGLAPYYDFEDAVSQEMRGELDAIKQGIIDGSINTSGSEDAPAEDAPAEDAPAEDAPAEDAPAEVAGKGGSYGQVTDAGGIDDKSFNQLAWMGMQNASESFGVEVKVLESKQQTDYEKNINEFLNEGYDGVVTVGFLLADATKAASEANPDVPMAIVDFPSQTSGDMGILFSADQPAFMAGYLSAGLSETGVVCTYGGMKIPPVVAFMVGFDSGIKYYNEQKETEVALLGWETNAEAEGGGEGAFIGNFESLDDGRSYAENFFDEGCDIIFPVAGPPGLGSAAATQDRGLKIIGTDADHVQTAPEFQDVYLTSVLKKIDVAVFEVVKLMDTDQFEGGSNFISTLENGGVGLAPYYDFEDAVSQEMRDELSVIEAGIIAGEISTGWPVE